MGFSPFEKEVEIGFAIGQMYQRRGLATEAVVAGTRWALDTFGLKRILGIAAVANQASSRTLEKAGFLRQRDCPMMFQGTEQMVSVYLFER